MLPWGLPGCQVSALATHTPDSTLPVSPSPTDIHTDITKNNLPATTVHQEEPLSPSAHFHLVGSTRQIASTCLTPESHLLLFRDTSIQPKKMALRTQQITHGEFRMIFTSPTPAPPPPPPSSPPQLVFPHISLQNLFFLFCCLPIFSSLEPCKLSLKDKQDFNRF